MLHLIGHVDELPHIFNCSMWDCSNLHPHMVREKFLLVYEKYILENWAIVSTQGEIFNVVGNMIGEGLISPDEVKYTLYYRDLSVTEGTYSEGGFLENYPYGFFDYGIDFHSPEEK